MAYKKVFPGQPRVRESKKNKIDLYTLNVLFSVRYINIVKMLIKSVNMERYLVIHIHR